MKYSASLAIVALSLMVSSRDAAAGLVTNGGFETQANGSATVVGQVDVFTTLQAWQVGPIFNSGQAHPFVFVVDSNADSTGFPSENGGNIKVWGPNSGSNNGFTGSPSGGKFLGIDADYAGASIYQDISGLTPGKTYTLSFDWAGSQFTDQSGATTQWWQVGFGNSPTQDTTHADIASKGFSGWNNASMTFTADSTTQRLTFTPKAMPFTNGAPAGLPPFLLLDGVTLTEPTPDTNPPGTPSVPEPTTALTAALGGICLVAVGLRRRAMGLAKA